MEQNEINNFIECELRRRWPMWKPTAVDLGDWAHFLGPVDYKTAQKAILGARARSSTVTFPVLANFCKALQAARPSRSAKRYITGVDCCMICTQSDKLECIKPGTRRDLYVYVPDHVQDPVQYAVNVCKNDIDKYNENRQMNARFEIHIVDDDYIKCLRRSTEIRTGEKFTPPKNYEEAKRRYSDMIRKAFEVPEDIAEIKGEDLIEVSEADDDLPF
jgi:hypothetical protein